MDQPAAARALTPLATLASRPRASRGAVDTFTLAAASRSEDDGVRRLLRASAFPGDVSLTLEREPDSGLAASIEGDVHDTIVARHQAGGEVAAIASRSVRDAYINGEVARLGYLGQLRIDHRFRRHRGLMDAGFRFCRQLHVGEAGAAPAIYLASVVADNRPARRLLRHRVPGWPSFEPVDTLVTLVIPVTKPSSHQASSALRFVRGSNEIADEIVSCLDRNGRGFHFHPRWTVADLQSPLRTRGLALEDFVVALRGSRVVGCAACWDQRAFKQVVVKAYSRRLSACRLALNAVAPWTGSPYLPPVGSALQFGYVSHLAVDDDENDGDVYAALVQHVCAAARTRSLDYVALGVSARSPVLTRLRNAFRHRAYESVLFVAFWPDGEAVAASLDGRPSNPELAIL